MTALATWLLSGFIVLYFLLVYAAIAWLRGSRKTRWPFKEEDKLLRAPGEELRRRIIAIDEAFLLEFFGGLLASLIIFGLLGDTLPKLINWPAGSAKLPVMFGGALVPMLVSVWRVGKLWRERANLYLGWFGERVVGEQLEKAKLQGWRVFHDVPFENSGAKFNIDHIAVGQGGVFVIETKTRRKGSARPGFKDNVVFFDGRDLVWPWSEDNHGLEQAERNALWLTNWIRTEIGERVHVSPILTLPGWWLENKPAKETRLCRVANPKWLPEWLARERPVLQPKQIELIANRLEARCRDVEA